MGKLVIPLDTLGKLFVEGNKAARALADCSATITTNNKFLADSDAFEGQQGEECRALNTKLSAKMESLQEKSKQISAVIDKKIGEAIKLNKGHDFGDLQDEIDKLLQRQLKR